VTKPGPETYQSASQTRHGPGREPDHQHNRRPSSERGTTIAIQQRLRARHDEISFATFQADKPH
jgi:hypothetical protein